MPELAVHMHSTKKVDMKSFANLEENSSDSVFFDRGSGLKSATLLKKLLQSAILLSQRLQRRCFSMNFAKCFRTAFFSVHPDDCFRNMAELITKGTYFEFSTALVQKQPSCSMKKSRS